MTTWILLAAIGAAPTDDPADSVTLKDGRAVLGQLIDPSPRGKLVIVVRRQWAAANLPDLAKRWEAAGAPGVKKAREQRLHRLKEWRRERPKVAGKDDPIGDWIDREIDRLGRPGPVEPSRLMVVSLNRGEARSIRRANPRSSRLLRLGWALNVPEAESMIPADLKSAIEAKGRLAEGPDPVPLDEFLPPQVEDSSRWMARRAATEVGQEAELRFIRFQDLLLPEGAGNAGQGDGMAAVGGVIQGLLGDRPAVDPLAARLQDLAARGRAGAMVTSLAIGENGSTMRVEATLWVRVQGDRWEPRLSRSSDSRSADARPDEAEAIASDPRIKAILGGVESLGLGTLTPDLKNAGASARRAIGMARSALQNDLDGLALPVASGN